MMRNVDGLQPQEAFEELLKFIFFKKNTKEEVLTSISTSAIRSRFAYLLEHHNSWSTSLWRDRDFHLSNRCLEQINAIFIGVDFSRIDFDIHSAALREFLTPEIRKGLGIYLTPDEVVREIVRFVDPPFESKCLDPACGSGTFLIELIKHWEQKKHKNFNVWGVDKNPRMLLISELNIGGFPGIVFHRSLMDSLTKQGPKNKKKWMGFGYFDFILTNPPFGVTVEASHAEYGGYDTAFTSKGEMRARQNSEWFFIEQSLKWLKPGGTLAIVLPKSIFTNLSSNHERSLLSRIGYVRAIIQLPPETFLVTGAQTNAVVAFIKRYEQESEQENKIEVIFANITNVGYDSTGRAKEGSQLLGLADIMLNPNGRFCDYVTVLAPMKARDTFGVLNTTGISKRAPKSGTPLGDVSIDIKTGRTPPRSAYSDKDGLFLIKVGNLTGAGINWIARERNFINESAVTARRFNSLELVRDGDIVLTSSAHSPVYIAKKSDIVTNIPEWVGGKASFVGEVMLIRADTDRISPMILLSYLRRPETIMKIQEMVRGQTAHLHPDDLKCLPIPESVISASEDWREVEDLIREETLLSERLNELAYRQKVIFSKIRNII